MPARTPAQIITDAVNAAHRQGITVSTDPRMGVRCPSSAAPRWERHPSAEAVSPLGAVLLAEQPPIELADEALCHVLGSKMLFHLGIEDGCGGAVMSANLTRGLDAQLYRDGWKLGEQLRVLISTVVCEPHRMRHLRGERCPMCAAGVPVPRPDEPTLRIVEPEA